ncbi:MAG: Fic family protein [SAR324 cluster bacterium]|nr:Fic family protein [SAR324 cluster bacterium]
MMVVKYAPPKNFLYFDLTQELFDALVAAKAGVQALRALPYQKNWMEPLREMELQREVAGTTMIEGATFTGGELEDALRDETPREAQTRSQRQVAAAKRAYEWIERAQLDVPVDRAIREIHRLIVTGCDEDRCEPGVLRKRDQNVTFGRPPHRGAQGGAELERTYEALVGAASTNYQEYDPLLQALALHCHIAAIHPFQDGNGRTARGVEAYFLRRAGYSTHGFIGLSNYYYEERDEYFRVLAETRQQDGNLSDFLIFALKGISLQCARIRNVIFRKNKVVLFKNMMHRVYRKYETPKRRHLSERQIVILEFLLDQREGKAGIRNLIDHVRPLYRGLKKEGHAFSRDMGNLHYLRAIIENGDEILVDLDWPQVLTDTEVGQMILEQPSAADLPKFRFR